jgi:hypothetical protein
MVDRTQEEHGIAIRYKQEQEKNQPDAKQYNKLIFEIIKYSDPTVYRLVDFLIFFKSYFKISLQVLKKSQVGI